MDEGEDSEREEELDPGHGEAVYESAVLRAPGLRHINIFIINRMNTDHLIAVGDTGQTQELHGPDMQLLNLETSVEQNGSCASKS